jgi:hypothetical protein
MTMKPLMLIAGIVLPISVASIASASTANLGDVTDPAKISERALSFDGELQILGFSGHVVSCARMIELSVGTANGNHSFGAVCKLQVGGNSRNVLLCDDDLVGHFALTSSFADSRDAIAQFTDHNCTGG